MKVIFLDFNGVLDTHFKMDEIDYDNLQRLKFIVSVTGAKIVISSSLKNTYWRSGMIRGLLKEVIDRLISEGMDVIDFTPMMDSREDEIKLYLDNHPEVSSYVILDDDYDMISMKEHMVKLPCQNIEGSLGLTDEYMKQALEILGYDKEKENVGLKLEKKNMLRRDE